MKIFGFTDNTDPLVAARARWSIIFKKSAQFYLTINKVPIANRFSWHLCGRWRGHQYGAPCGVLLVVIINKEAIAFLRYVIAAVTLSTFAAIRKMSLPKLKGMPLFFKWVLTPGDARRIFDKQARALIRNSWVEFWRERFGWKPEDGIQKTLTR